MSVKLLAHEHLGPSNHQTSDARAPSILRTSSHTWTKYLHGMCRSACNHINRETKLVQRLLCGTLCFLKLRHQALDLCGFVNKNTGHFPSHSIIINNRRAIIPSCFRRIGAQQLQQETTSTHSGNQGKRKHSPAPQHSTKNGHFRQLGLVHQYIQCSFCGFAQKLPRTTAHPLANKIYKQHTRPHSTINNNPHFPIFMQTLVRLSARLLSACAAA